MATLDSALWRDIMDYLRQRHAPLCRAWFDQLAPVDLNAGLLRVHVGNRVHRDYLQRKCLEPFTEAAQMATGALVGVKFIDADAEQAWVKVKHRPTKPPVAGATPPAHTTDNGHGKPNGNGNGHRQHRPTAAASSRFTEPFDDEQLLLNPDYTFDTFVTGPGNRLAYAASVSVSNQPGQRYNPLFIHGGVGLGKTHLLQAICNTIIQDNPDVRICYVSCDTFVNRFLEYVQNKTMDEFRARYRLADVLVIDDIHFLANRERTQEEFFHTFNELYQAKKQIVLSSDSPPKEIPQLEDRLVSRFQWGLVANVTQPDFDTRVAIIRAKLKVREIDMPDDVVQYIANKMDANARELEGALTTIQAAGSLVDGAITLPMAREVLGDPPTEARSSQVTLQHIIDEVTRFYSVKLSELQSKKRHKSITEPRQLCMWLARKRTRFSLQETGHYFGGRDHTTVMHSIRMVDERIDQDDQFAQQVDHLEHRVAQTM